MVTRIRQAGLIRLGSPGWSKVKPGTGSTGLCPNQQGPWSDVETDTPMTRLMEELKASASA